MGAGPRADFVCLSRKCQKDGQQPTYELPIDAIRCPCCGSKRVKRLYNAVNISQPGFYRVNRLVDVEVANAELKAAQADKTAAEADTFATIETIYQQTTGQAPPVR